MFGFDGKIFIALVDDVIQRSALSAFLHPLLLVLWLLLLLVLPTVMLLSPRLILLLSGLPLLLSGGAPRLPLATTR
jgi:hypothetical protein